MHLPSSEPHFQLPTYGKRSAYMYIWKRTTPYCSCCTAPMLIGYGGDGTWRQIHRSEAATRPMQDMPRNDPSLSFPFANSQNVQTCLGENGADRCCEVGMRSGLWVASSW